jgi:hypothetical protein
MAKTIELYWDVGSTNTYFALKLIRPGPLPRPTGPIW